MKLRLRTVYFKLINVGNNKTAILSEEISENVFPSEDIDELKKGVEFDNLDEAQQMFENFVS